MPFRSIAWAGLLTLLPTVATAQLVVWAEEFENGCTGGCYASAYSTGPNGAWSVVNTGTNGACANRWFISCTENGNAVGACGTSCTSANETLHVGNDVACASPNGCFFCPGGDCGAAYDASCPPGLCAFCCSCNSAQTDQRATSPVIDLTGRSGATLSFQYMEGGQGTQDNATLWYYNGSVWSQLADMAKTATGCGGQGIWTAYTVPLPASANNNPNVRIGFRWVNNNDGSGADPSFAVDNVQITVAYVPDCVGPLVNELGNGPAGGSKEYLELLVCGPACSTVDLRRWKLDDNNGVLLNGFGTSLTSSGTTAGHLRFSNAAQWAAVPTGALVLVYNEADPHPLLPPNDPDDSAPNDSVYVLPANSPLLEGCALFPDANSSSSYGTCTFGASSWNLVGLRNDGDAGQTRRPDGTYFHGISYGSNANNMNGGGIDALRISTVSHSGRVISFTGSDPRSAAAFTSAPIAGNETPGAPNNAANAAYIAALRCVVLPVGLVAFTATPEHGTVRTAWTTATETGNDHFTVERSADGSDFRPVGSVPGAGHSVATLHYLWTDAHPLPGTAYYRLRQTDFDGNSALSPVVSVRMPEEAGRVVVQGEDLLVGGGAAGAWQLVDPLGRVVGAGSWEAGGTVRIPLAGMASSLLLLRMGDRRDQRTHRVLRGAEGVMVEAVR